MLNHWSKLIPTFAGHFSIFLEPLKCKLISRLLPCSGVMEFCEVSTFASKVPSWLNKELIEKSLRLGYNDTNLSVTKFSVVPATTPGDNYVSDLYRVTSELVNNGKGRSVIIKCIPSVEYNLKFIHDARLFEKEIQFYNVTLPTMGALYLAPHCMYTQDDLLVLEDLSPMGFKLVNRRIGLDLVHCRFAIKALARLHAHSLSVPALQLAKLYPETVYHDKDHAYRYIKHSLMSLAGIVKSWSGYERFSEKIGELSDTVLDKVLNLMPTTSPKEYLRLFVLNHGDFWTNNIMFKYDGSVIQEVKLIDFQMCRYASLALDLQYFIYTSVNESYQTNCEDALLEDYRLELCRMLQQDDYITADQLKAEMNRTNVFGFVNACMMLPVVLSDPTNDSPDLGSVAETSTKDSNTLDWHTGSLFRHRFQQLLLHFEQKGLFSNECRSARQL